MSCKALKLDKCEVAGSIFEGRKLSFADRNIALDTFTANVKDFRGVQIAQLQGVVSESDVYFDFSELESLSVGSYKIDYWAEFKDLAKEIIAVENLKVSREPCGCEYSQDATFSVEIKHETIALSVSYSVVNIGGGGSGGNGKSAYEIAVENGFVGTEVEWLASLKGKDGKDGINGRDGVDGKDGAKGDPGPAGPQGIQGPKGDTGATGVKGDKGDKGDTGATGLQGIQGLKGDKGDFVPIIKATSESNAVTLSQNNPSNIYYY